MSTNKKTFGISCSEVTYSKAQEFFNKLINTQMGCSDKETAINYVIDTYKNNDDFNDIKAHNQELTTNNQDLSSQLTENSAEIAQLKQNITALEVQLTETENRLAEKEVTSTENAKSAHIQLTNYETKEQELNQKIAELTQKTVLDHMPEFPRQLLIITAGRLSHKYNKTVTPIQILTDMFLRYTVEQNTNWFYDFCIGDKELIEVAAAINPQISNMRQIKAIIGLNKKPVA